MGTPHGGRNPGCTLGAWPGPPASVGASIESNRVPYGKIQWLACIFGLIWGLKNKEHSLYTVHQKKVCTLGCFYVLICSATLQKSPIKNIFFVWLEDVHFFPWKVSRVYRNFLTSMTFLWPLLWIHQRHVKMRHYIKIHFLLSAWNLAARSSFVERPTKKSFK